MKSTPENLAKVEFEKYISKLSTVKLFSNIRGNFWAGKLIRHTGTSVLLGFARRLKAGWGPDGAPDYIGWRQYTIQPKDVGKTIAQFCAAELKRFDGKGKATVEQIECIEFLNRQGALACMINSLSEAQEIFGNDK